MIRKNKCTDTYTHKHKQQKPHTRVYTDATWGLNRLPGASDINERNVRARARDRRPVADAEACTATVASSDVRVCIRRVWLVDRRVEGGWGGKFCRASAIYRVSRAELIAIVL